MVNIKELISHFDVTGELLCVTPYGEGHINDTYYLNVSDRRYILQRINSNIFKSPPEIMSNIEKITNHLRKKAIERGGEPSRETLNIIYTKDGLTYHKTPDNEYYRIYDFIVGAKTYQSVEQPIHFFNAGKAFGKFQKQLSDFPAAELFDPIPNFHNTVKRFENLMTAVKNDKIGRAKSVTDEIEFAIKREKDTDVLLELMEKGAIPIRVTHNDTKYNNIMIDDITQEGICIIDLDTVMPGTLLYDYGESIRFGASAASEDEKDLSKVYVDLHLFELFTQGFFGELQNELTQAEIEYAPFAAKLMTYENGLRFLTDYLDGDVYFKTHYPQHNLDRARTQFKLVADMENKMNVMKEVVSKNAKTGARCKVRSSCNI